MAKQDVVAQVKAARKAAVPLLAVATADQWAVEQLLLAEAFSKAPVVRWDCIRGYQALNDAAKAEVSKLPQDPAAKKAQCVPAAALEMADRFGKFTVVMFHNAALFLGQAAVVQAISNLRDEYKGDNRMLVLLSPQFTLPPTLVSDVVVVEEELPKDAQLRQILDDLYQDVEGAVVPNDETARHAIDAARGLSAFAAETALAMSMTPEGLDVDTTWQRKAGQVNQTPGLKIRLAKGTFEQLRGMDSAVDFGRLLGQGPAPIRAVVLLDEIEKMLGGAQGDTSGVSQDALGVILRAMEGEGWDGMIAVGPPGAGKTAFADALAGENNVPMVTVDLGAMKGSLVGQSEGLIRDAMRVIRHIAGDGAYFVGTCNKLEALPPELRRRYRAGQWFFDLPTPEERLAIWPVHLKAYGLDGKYTPEQADAAAQAEGWTGAEIRNVCERAWKLGVGLEKARQFIVPVSKSDPESVRKLREAATGKFLSASHSGTVGEAVVAEARPRRAVAR